MIHTIQGKGEIKEECIEKYEQWEKYIKKYIKHVSGKIDWLEATLKDFQTVSDLKGTLQQLEQRISKSEANTIAPLQKERQRISHDIDDIEGRLGDKNKEALESKLKSSKVDLDNMIVDRLTIKGIYEAMRDQLQGSTADTSFDNRAGTFPSPHGSHIDALTHTQPDLANEKGKERAIEKRSDLQEVKLAFLHLKLQTYNNAMNIAEGRYKTEAAYKKTNQSLLRKKEQFWEDLVLLKQFIARDTDVTAYDIDKVKKIKSALIRLKDHKESDHGIHTAGEPYNSKTINDIVNLINQDHTIQLFLTDAIIHPSAVQGPIKQHQGTSQSPERQATVWQEQPQVEDLTEQQNIYDDKTFGSMYEITKITKPDIRKAKMGKMGLSSDTINTLDRLRNMASARKGSFPSDNDDKFVEEWQKIAKQAKGELKKRMIDIIENTQNRITIEEEHMKTF